MTHDPRRSSARNVTLLATIGALALGSTAANKGCANAEDSSDVAQAEIVTQYWVSYDARSDKTTARATFRFGNELGTVLQLQPPAQVTFGAAALPFDANWGWHYNEIAGRVDAGSFAYRDTEGAERRTNVPAFAPAELPNSIALSRAASSSVSWQGAPIAEGEEIEVYVASAANRLNIVRFATNASGASSLVLTPDRLAQLPPGAVVLSLNRHRTLRPDARTKVTTTWAARDGAAELR